MPKETEVATKSEVLQRLSDMLRNGRTTMKDDIFLKVMGAYAKLQGWIK
jgi:hypothetical protein